MQVDPNQSREAHPETDLVERYSTASPAAASSLSRPHSPAEELSDPRGPQLAPCRGEGASQQFPPLTEFDFGPDLPDRRDAVTIALAIVVALLFLALAASIPPEALR